MNQSAKKAEPSASPESRPSEIRALTNQILEQANSGLPRPEFLKDISERLLKFSGCDYVRLVLIKRGRSYRCRAARDASEPFRFEETPLEVTPGWKVVWTSGENEPMEQVCRSMADQSFDASLEWFTDNGSFWLGDRAESPFPDMVEERSGVPLGVGVGPGTRSLALLTVDTGSSKVGLLELESKSAHFLSQPKIESYEFVAQTLGIALAHRTLQEELRERVKELTCLYGIARLAANPDISLEEVLKSAIRLLPPGWLFPEICCARIVLDNQTYTTRNFRNPVQSMRADIAVEGQERGFVEVGYTWEKPDLDEGPFLVEERSLINAIANEISVIVEQDQAESEKKRLREQLLHADRLATIGQLGAGLAHELNEPLANVLGFAQLISKDNKLSAQVRHDVEKIISASLHAREIISKVLVFARETRSEKKPLDLNKLVEEGLHFLRLRCAKVGIELDLKLGGGLPELVADQSQMHQVLTNLVVNSIQAMPNGGRLTISTVAEKDDVILTVTDTGTGMSPETVRDAFNPFFTTKDVDQGTGLGLSVVHGIITSHGGSIEVESKINSGTNIVIRLPAGGKQGREVGRD